MASPPSLDVQIWSPLPPQASGVADYVFEQLDGLEESLALTLVAEAPAQVEPRIVERYNVVYPEDADSAALRIYHVGNSPAHGYIYQEAVRVPGVVVLHEWNLHELVLGLAVQSRDFSGYRRQMRREHGERGAVAAETVAATLGGRFWTSVFPINAELLEQALGLVCLSGSTAARAAARSPGVPLLHLPHHCVLKSRTHHRLEARERLGLPPRSPVILAPGLGTTSKSQDVVRAAVERVLPRFQEATLVFVGGVGGEGAQSRSPHERSLGRVDLETLGDALLAADVVVALRFPSRGEASGVVMRALAAGRALVVSAGSTADEDLPQGVVARVSPGPEESQELAVVLDFLLREGTARQRMESLALSFAQTRPASRLAERLSEFVHEVSDQRESLESKLRARRTEGKGVRQRFRHELEAAAASLELFRLPRDVFEKLEGL